jgi:hypothetical protein
MAAQLDHGTRRRYQAGCRCAPCVEANRLYQQAWRLSLCGSPSSRQPEATTMGRLCGEASIDLGADP